MNFNSIFVFQDNYIWVLINDEGCCVIVDFGEVVFVLKVIVEYKWMLEVIFLMYYYYDYVGGVKELL